MKNDLPPYWVLANMRDIAEINPGKKGIELNDSDEVAFIPMSAVEAKTGNYSSNVVKPYSAVKKGYTPFIDGDVIFAKITPCMENGKVALVEDLKNGVGFGSTEFHVLRPSDGIDGKFLFYYLSRDRFREDAAHHMTGTAGQRRVPRSYLDSALIPLPPLAEQCRIAAKIERLFSAIESAENNLQEGKEKIHTLKKSYLKSALSGDLTRKWREKHRGEEVNFPMCALNEFTSGHCNVQSISPESLPDSWKWTTLGNIIENFDGARIPTKEKDREKRPGPYPYYGASGVIDKIDGYTHEGDFLLISEDGANLLSRNQPIAFQTTGRIWVNNHAHVIKTKYDIPLSYIENYLNYIDISRFVTGTAQPKLTQKAMNSIEVPIPPLQEQIEMMIVLGRLATQADGTLVSTNTSLQRVSGLRQSILMQAFKGKLVPQDPNDEPAERLLERIRAERMKGKPNSRNAGAMDSNDSAYGEFYLSFYSYVHDYRNRKR